MKQLVLLIIVVLMLLATSCGRKKTDLSSIESTLIKHNDRLNDHEKRLKSLELSYIDLTNNLDSLYYTKLEIKSKLGDLYLAQALALTNAVTSLNTLISTNQSDAVTALSLAVLTLNTAISAGQIDAQQALLNAISDLESQIFLSSNSVQILLNGAIGNLQAQIDALNTTAILSQSQASALELQLITVNNSIALTNTLAVGTQAQLATLTLNLAAENRIVGMIDPCGDLPNAYDEVILVTSKGDYIAYFEDGGERFLSKLISGVQYRTTDSQKCLFTL